MSTFVSVHGTWHDNSAWKTVIKHLQAQGHQAFSWMPLLEFSQSKVCILSNGKIVKNGQ
jgi:hypothetical protein